MQTENLVDKVRLQKGLFLVKKLEIADKTIYFYDLRFISPLQEDPSKGNVELIHQKQAHSIEHLISFYLRYASEEAYPEKDSEKTILTLRPFGSQTGFECLSLFKPTVFTAVLIRALEISLMCPEIPDNNKVVCANVFSNDLQGAKKIIASFHSAVLKQLSEDKDSIVSIPRVNALNNGGYLPLEANKINFESYV